MKHRNLKRSVVIGTMFVIFFSAVFLPVSNTLADKVKNIENNPTSCETTTPAIDGPSSCDINDTVTFYISAEDDEDLQIKYLIDWKYYGKSFTIEEETPYYTSGFTINIDHKFETGGTYDIAVIAENENGEQSEMAVHNFNVNGGQIIIKYIEKETKPKRFLPKQEVEFYSTVENIGNRDFYGPVTRGQVYFDGIKITPTQIKDPFLLEAGKTCSGGEYSHIWPDDLNEHLIKFSFMGETASLKKSAVDVNLPPDKPYTPSGKTHGKPGEVIYYGFRADDPCEHDVYYMIDWGDNTTTEWIGPYESGERITESHSWTVGAYYIKVKAKDEYGAESEWSDSLEVVIEKDKAADKTIFNFLQNHHIFLPISQLLIEINSLQDFLNQEDKI